MSTLEELESEVVIRREAYKRAQGKLDHFKFQEQLRQQQFRKERQDHLRKTVAILPEHLALLKAMEFERYDDGGDLVFIGVDGKRPFGNSDIYGDVAEILRWDDDEPFDQVEAANQLFDELPVVLNSILSRLYVMSDHRLILK